MQQKRIKVVLRRPPRIRLVMRHPPRIMIRMKVTPGGAAPTYGGPYAVDPKFEEIRLQTAGKRMTDDVTVHAIEVSRTSNPQGGRTIYIGGILNG